MGFSGSGDFLALAMLLGEMWSAAGVATGTVKWIGWQGKVWGVMIWGGDAKACIGEIKRN